MRIAAATWRRFAATICVAWGASASEAFAYCFCPECLLGTFESFQPVSGSMKPAIEPDACVIVLKSAAVIRGSIIVFRHPQMPDTPYIKRLIGLPGDSIEMIEGRLVLNGVPISQTEAAPYEQVMQKEGRLGSRPICPSATPEGETCEIDTYVEEIDGSGSWRLLDTFPDGFTDTFGPVTIPADHVFVMGDHRDNSTDSRVPLEAGGLGFVPIGNIVGRVTEIANP